MSLESLKSFRDHFQLDIKDEDIPNYPYITFPEGSEEYNYLQRQTLKALNGYLPKRLPKFTTEFKSACFRRICPIIGSSSSSNFNYNGIRAFLKYFIER